VRTLERELLVPAGRGGRFRKLLEGFGLHRHDP
jgi:hypothetical protein